MSYLSLSDCVLDLEKHQHLIRISEPLSAHLEIAAIQRRVYRAGGPALLFTRVEGCRFPLLGNMFGTMDRTRFIFRRTLRAVQTFINAKINPEDLLKHPLRYARALPVLAHIKPKMVSTGPVLANRTIIAELPQLISWPKDAGGFITLPQVYTEHPDQPGIAHSNLGMYRIQLSGNQYTNEKIGLHYQTHRGIGVHHEAARAKGRNLNVSIFVGGSPALSLAAVMPLPEGVPELYFAGALNGRRVRLIRSAGSAPLHADADFCITGEVVPGETLPEGPFGDHLGYYSLKHEYPVLRVKQVLHRNNAIWPFTVVGRPPQEDTSFGQFIHELTGPVIPTVLPGVHGVHAVDATGVHPLLLAIGSERYTPYQELTRPQELLTQASAILGQGQLSLAKYLLIANFRDNPDLDLHDIPAFLRHVLERADWRRDLHFQTETNIDTLDYSGAGLNRGSKLIIAAVGPAKHQLMQAIPGDLKLPAGFHTAKLALPGVLVIQAPNWNGSHQAEAARMEYFCGELKNQNVSPTCRLIILADDSDMTARTLDNFLWITFTRSDPARDIYGVGAYTENKHWACAGPLVIDARIKIHHAPPLEEDAEIEKKIDALALRGGPLYGLV